MNDYNKKNCEKYYLLYRENFDGEKHYDSVISYISKTPNATEEQIIKEFMKDNYGENTEWDEFFEAWIDEFENIMRIKEVKEITKAQYDTLKELGI